MTRTFRLPQGLDFEGGKEGQILRRLLMPRLGRVDYLAGKRLLIVKDTKPVVRCFAALVDHFDNPSRLDLVSKSICIRYCGNQLMQPNGELLRVLRRVLTPARGELEFDPKTGSLLVRDTESKQREIASIVKQVDVEPCQVLMSIRFVATADASVWKTKIAPAAGATGHGMGTLTAKEAQALMQKVEKDPASQVVQAPKLIALDHCEASVVVGDATKGSKRGTAGFELTLVPHAIPGTDKFIVDIVGDKKPLQALVRSGGTIVYRYFDAAKREVVVFVTPTAIRTPR